MKTWAWLLAAACAVGGLLLSGCGAEKPAAPVVSALAGNWLLVGPMPSRLLDPTPTGRRLAITLDINGNNIAAVGVVNNFCDNVESSFDFGGPIFPATGSVAADGSFTLATPPNAPFQIVSIKGMVPQTSGGAWPGSYALSLTSSFMPKCDANLS